MSELCPTHKIYFRRRKESSYQLLPLEPTKHANNHKNSNHSDAYKMTKNQFMSQPMGAFINNDFESNDDIAKNIVTFFESRDDGTYAAIVSDEGCNWSCWYAEGKCKCVQNCRGKYITVWKQRQSDKLLKNFNQTTVRSVVKGLILDNQNNASKIKQG
eukprot:898548_1